MLIPELISCLKRDPNRSAFFLPPPNRSPFFLSPYCSSFFLPPPDRSPFSNRPLPLLSNDDPSHTMAAVGVPAGLFWLVGREEEGGGCTVQQQPPQQRYKGGPWVLEDQLCRTQLFPFPLQAANGGGHRALTLPSAPPPPNEQPIPSTNKVP